MPNIMFKVGNTDYSANVIDNNNGYKVQKNPIYTEWTDANGRDHRSVYRYRTEGTFTMLFKTMEDYDAFCQTLEANVQNDSSYPLAVFDNNSGTQVTSHFYLSYTPIRHRSNDRDGDDWVDYMAAISVTIKEC